MRLIRKPLWRCVIPSELSLDAKLFHPKKVKNGGALVPVLDLSEHLGLSVYGDRYPAMLAPCIAGHRISRSAQLWIAFRSSTTNFTGTWGRWQYSSVPLGAIPGPPELLL